MSRSKCWCYAALFVLIGILSHDALMAGNAHANAPDETIAGTRDSMPHPGELDIDTTHRFQQNDHGCTSTRDAVFQNLGAGTRANAALEPALFRLEQVLKQSVLPRDNVAPAPDLMLLFQVFRI